MQQLEGAFGHDETVCRRGDMGPEIGLLDPVRPFGPPMADSHLLGRPRSGIDTDRGAHLTIEALEDDRHLGPTSVGEELEDRGALGTSTNASSWTDTSQSSSSKTPR
jgi:hypothetical protein